MAKIDKWVIRYLRIAREISTWTSCLRRGVGCVITKDHRIVATGYNGAPSGMVNCRELGYCLRQSAKSGDSLDQCLAIHAEQNALIQASKLGASVKGGEVFVTTKPCTTCMKLIAQAGIRRVYCFEDYPNKLSQRIADEVGVEVIFIDPNLLDKKELYQ